LAGDSTLLEKHLARYARSDENAFAALNTAFFQDGAFIHVPAGKIVTEPVQLVFVSTAKEAGATIHPRNLIIAESQTRLTVIASRAPWSISSMFIGLSSISGRLVGAGFHLGQCPVNAIAVKDGQIRVWVK
jgi:Fe-S cluster assembly scaffold protein SufB